MRVSPKQVDFRSKTSTPCNFIDHICAHLIPGKSQKDNWPNIVLERSQQGFIQVVYKPGIDASVESTGISRRAISPS
jgi:hypothetical protein